MKPFDIELAKKNHPIQTRDGKPARIICYNRKSNIEYPIVALVKFGDIENAMYYTEKGIYHDKESSLDLFMASTKKEGWINLFKDEKKGYIRLARSGLIHESKDAALYSVDNDPNYVTTIKIEWEE